MICGLLRATVSLCASATISSPRITTAPIGTSSLDAGEPAPVPRPKTDVGQWPSGTPLPGFRHVRARLAASKDEVPIGAVVMRGDEIVAEAHNETVARSNPTYHAEFLAIERRSRRWKLIGSPTARCT